MRSNEERTDDHTRDGEKSATEARPVQHNWESGNPIYVTVIKAVSTVTEQKSTEMEPLYSVIDPDAVEALMTSSRGGHVRLSFSYEGCTVSIEHSGAVVVQAGG